VKKGKKVDLVILDIDIADGRGTDVAEKIRKFEAENGINACSIIYVTGSAEEKDLKAIEQGDLFLKKPASFDDITNFLGKRVQLTN
jgi:CheY-like chemotaxis protein